MKKSIHNKEIALSARHRGWLRCLDNCHNLAGSSYLYRVNKEAEADGEYEIDLHELSSELNRIGYGNVSSVPSVGLIKIVDPVCQMLEQAGVLSE